MQSNENNLVNFKLIYTFQGIFFVKKERTIGSQCVLHIPKNSSLQKFLDHLVWSHTTSQQPTPPPSPGRKLQQYYLQLLSKGPHCPPSPLTLIKKPLLPQLFITGGSLPPISPNKTPLLPPATIMPVFLNVWSISSKTQRVMIKLTTMSPSVLMF